MENLNSGRYQLITPEMAKTLLEKKNARPLRSSKVKQFANDMSRGGFRYDTKDPISIGISGMVLNGNHRLAAIIQSGKPGYFIVYTNQPDELFNYYDRGTPRTNADILKINGVANSTIMATIISISRTYLLDGRKLRSCPMLNDEVYNYYKENEQLLNDAYNFGSNLYNISGIIPKTHLASLYVYSYIYKKPKIITLLTDCIHMRGSKQCKAMIFRRSIINTNNKGAKLHYNDLFALVKESI